MLYKSCSECKHKCCKTGPGPYTEINPKDYNDIANNPEGYNTKCKYFDLKTEMCTIWNTNKIPLLCKTWICWLKEYTQEELDNINKLLKKEGL